MALKVEFGPHLRAFRGREFERIFGACAPGTFRRVLELGSGEAVQARMLLGVADEVVATDFHPSYSERAPEADARLTFRRCDAERPDAELPNEHFDLIFSSNVYEHLGNPLGAILSAERLLAPGGLMVHVMPSTFWKMAQIALHFPNELAVAVEKLERRPAHARALSCTDMFENNPKVLDRHGWVRRHLWPTPHGAYPSNAAELVRYARGRWTALFERAGLVVAGTIKGPVASGYGFGLDRMRRTLERMGLTSEWIYVLHRPGERPEVLDRVGAGSGARIQATRSVRA